MRRQDLEKLNEPYAEGREKLDRRFASAIGAGVPSAGELEGEVFNDLNPTTLGIAWWTSLPREERILISDYLYQCVDGIEQNLIEAKLHYMEFEDARDRINERIKGMVSLNRMGGVDQKHPPSLKASDDLHFALEKLHTGGFFRAIGSSLDCLGAAIIGVMALPSSLRKSDILRAQDSLRMVKENGRAGHQLQLEFREFLEDAIADGPEDWFVWATQYRNLFVHRGRRVIHNSLVDSGLRLFDSEDWPIIRVDSIMHLAKYPDKSDAEAFILGRNTLLNEGAHVTLPGIFNSCQELLEKVCERLVTVWKERRLNPHLLEQPIAQWKDASKSCHFMGYKPESPSLDPDIAVSNPALAHRMLAAAVYDHQRHIWADTKWNR